MQTNRGSFDISNVFFLRNTFSSFCIRFRESSRKGTINKSVFAGVIRLSTFLPVIPPVCDKHISDTEYREQRDTSDIVSFLFVFPLLVKLVCIFYIYMLNGTLCVITIHPREKLLLLSSSNYRPMEEAYSERNTHLSTREQCLLSSKTYPLDTTRLSIYSRTCPICMRLLSYFCHSKLFQPSTLFCTTRSLIRKKVMIDNLSECSLLKGTRSSLRSCHELIKRIFSLFSTDAKNLES